MKRNETHLSEAQRHASHSGPQNNVFDGLITQKGPVEGNASEGRSTAGQAYLGASRQMMEAVKARRG
jgi:hypothetical protein